MNAHLLPRQLVEINRVLNSSGFFKRLDNYALPDDSPPEGIIYVDVPGNEIRLTLSYRAPDLAVNSIKAVCNGKKSMEWDSLEAFLTNIRQDLKILLLPSKEPAAPSPKTGKRTSRKLNIVEVLRDVRAGMDDEALMEKHRLSRAEILKVLSKLLWEGLLSAEELSNRRFLAKTVYMPVFSCQSCGNIHFENLEACPKCGGRMARVGEKLDEGR